MARLAFGNLGHFDVFHYDKCDYVKMDHTFTREVQDGQRKSFNVWNMDKLQQGSFQQRTSIVFKGVYPEVSRAALRLVIAKHEQRIRTQVMKDAQFWEYVGNGPYFVPLELSVHYCTQIYATMRTNPHKEPQRLEFHATLNEAKPMAIPKQAHMLALLQENMTTVHVYYNDRDSGGDGGTLYTFKCTHQQAAVIQRMIAHNNTLKGSPIMEQPWAIVFTGGKFKIVKIHAVDAIPQLDLDAHYEYKWIVSVLDTDEYQDQMAKERKAKDLLIQGEKAKLKKELIENLGLSNGNTQLLLEVQTALGVKPTGVDGEPSKDSTVT